MSCYRGFSSNSYAKSRRQHKSSNADYHKQSPKSQKVSSYSPVSQSITSRNDFVHGCGDIPRNDSDFSTNHNELNLGNTKSSRNSKRRNKMAASASKTQRVAPVIGDEENSDKRQKLLEWLEASQAKRDENNKQLFSKWVEKIDSMKAQAAREQNEASPAFYCNTLPPPNVIYSAVCNLPGDMIGIPTIFLGLPRFAQDGTNVPTAHPLEIDSYSSLEWESFQPESDFGTDKTSAEFPDDPSRVTSTTMDFPVPLRPGAVMYSIPVMSIYNTFSAEGGIGGSSQSLLSSSPLMIQPDIISTSYIPSPFIPVSLGTQTVNKMLNPYSEGVRTPVQINDNEMMQNANTITDPLQFNIDQWNGLLKEISCKTTVLTKDPRALEQSQSESIMNE